MGVRFRRQFKIGHYIADFACPVCKLVIELDGGQHAEQQNYDEAREKFMAAQGYRTIRFWNTEIFEHMDGVMVTIYNALKEKA